MQKKNLAMNSATKIYWTRFKNKWYCTVFIHL